MGFARYSEHVEQARWFGGKGRAGRLEQVQPLSWMHLDDELGVRPEIATWLYADGSVEYYQLLVSYRPMPQDGHLGMAIEGTGVPAGLCQAHDATHDPQALSAVLSALLHGPRDDSSWAAIINDGRELSSELACRAHTGEQSNTNILLGDAAILKLFRRLEPGRNRDIEVHDALGRSGVASAARLMGWVEGSFTTLEQTTEHLDLAMVVEQLQQAVDGWELARSACAAGIDFGDHAAALGTALAEVHSALHGSFPVETCRGDEIADAMLQRLDRAIEQADVLAPYRQGLVATFDRLRGRELEVQRVHGDFHLGQALQTPLGWRIIDFEGEPMKSFDERQAPDSAWRDVAGMLRSFSYATSGSTDRSGADAQRWLCSSRARFLEAYCGGLDDVSSEILAAYEADKVVYEVLYEVRNRPDWLSIPMAALSAIASTTGATPGTTDAAMAAEQEN